MAGLIVAQAVASWFLLRRGYSKQLRIAAFTWAAFGIALGIVRFLILRRGFQ